MASTSGGSATTTGGAQTNGGSSSSTGGAPSTGGAAAAGATNTSGGASTTGGAPSTGGSAGASSGGTGGAAANACATALFCDDFETYAKGQTPSGNWKGQLNAGTIGIDEAQRYSGSKSVKFTTEGKAGTKTAYLRLTGTTIFPVTGNAFFGRMMFRLDSAPTASVHWTFIQGGGLIAGQSYRAVYRYGGQQPVTTGGAFVGNQLMANYETPDSYGGNGPSSDCWHHANKTVVPVAKWTCAEWQFDGANNAMAFWLDGTALTDLSVARTGQGCVHQPATYQWAAPTFDYVDLGWESYQPDEVRTLWIDDVAISKQRVGCPP